jgi:hypothetical protein
MGIADESMGGYNPSENQHVVENTVSDPAPSLMLASPIFFFL